MSSTPGNAGVIVISAWREGSGLRARIIETLDVTTPETSVATAGSVEEVLVTVQASLEAFLTQRGSVQ
jgi:hypothetical protein